MPALFDAPTFNEYVHFVLNKLHSIRVGQDKEIYPDVKTFLDSTIQQTRSISRFLHELFFNFMHPLDYNIRDRAKRQQEKTILREKRLVARVMKHLNTDPPVIPRSGVLGAQTKPQTLQKKRLRSGIMKENSASDASSILDGKETGEMHRKKRVKRDAVGASTSSKNINPVPKVDPKPSRN